MSNERSNFRTSPEISSVKIVRSKAFSELILYLIFNPTFVLNPVIYFVYFVYFDKANSRSSQIDKHKQFCCDMMDCAIYFFLNAIGMWSVLDMNYSFFCMLVYVPIAVNITAYELLCLWKLLREPTTRRGLFLSLLSFYYGTNLMSSTIIGLILLRGLFDEYRKLIAD